MFQTCGNILRLFPTFFEDGSAILEYNIIGEVEVDEIRNVIYQNTQIEKDDIVVNIEDERLSVELPFMELEPISELDGKISLIFPESIQTVEVASVGPIDLSSSFVVIYSMFCIVFLIGFILSVKGTILFFKVRAHKLEVK